MQRLWKRTWLGVTELLLCTKFRSQRALMRRLLLQDLTDVVAAERLGEKVFTTVAGSGSQGFRCYHRACHPNYRPQHTRHLAPPKAEHLNVLPKGLVRGSGSPASAGNPTDGGSGGEGKTKEDTDVAASEEVTWREGGA